MKKGVKILISSIAVICLIAYNVLFFIFFGFEKGAGIWCAYIAGDAVLLLVAILPWFFKKKAKNTTREEEIIFVKKISFKIKALTDSCPIAETAQILTNLYYKIHSSQTCSCEEAKKTENEIASAVHTAQLAANGGDWNLVKMQAEIIEKLIIERNDILRINNIKF